MAGDGRMVAIVAERNTTIHPGSGGVIVRDSWAFGAGNNQSLVYWRYMCY